MTTYYIEIRKSRRRNEKQNFERAMLLKKKTEHGQLTSERTKRTHTKRYLSERQNKILGIR